MSRSRAPLHLVHTLADLRRSRGSQPGSLGLVPTMGYLHRGHMELVARARAENQWVGVSIFVNPTQFAPQEDLAHYPRDTEGDLALLEAADVDTVWLPTVDEVYPAGFQTWVEVGEVAQPLEGRQRPGHFRGVATVVAKLFHAFTPNRAYFGQKDAQQVAVIRRMVLDLNFPLQLVICPTVREADGLALSSRNKYFSPQERQAAPVLYRALERARAAHADGERQAARLRALMNATLAAEPLARVQYVSVAEPDSMVELEEVRGRALLSVAVYIGNTRLIDNVVVSEAI